MEMASIGLLRRWRREERRERKQQKMTDGALSKPDPFKVTVELLGGKGWLRTESGLRAAELPRHPVLLGRFPDFSSLIQVA